MSFTDRQVDFPNRKRLTPVPDQPNVYDLVDVPGTVTNAGTPLTAGELSNASNISAGTLSNLRLSSNLIAQGSNVTVSRNAGTGQWTISAVGGGTGAIAPTTNGSSGQVLKSNGTATPVWATLSTINGQSLLDGGNISVSCSCSGSGGTGGFTYLDTYWGYPTCDYNTTFGLHGGFWPLWEDKAVLVNIELDARDGQTNTSRSFSLTFPKGGWGTYVLWNDYVNGTTYYIIKCGENEAAYYGNTPGKIWFYAYDTSGQNISPLYAQMEVIQIGD